MNYLSTTGCALILALLATPADAGNGNALAGGWNGSLSGSTLQIGGTAAARASAGPTSQPGPSAGRGANASAQASAGASSGGSLFDFSLSSGGGQNVGAPGPEAGAGLSFLLLAGAYALLRRRRAIGRA